MNMKEQSELKCYENRIETNRGGDWVIRIGLVDVFLATDFDIKSKLIPN